MWREKTGIENLTTKKKYRMGNSGMERLYYLSNLLWRHKVSLLPRALMLLIHIIYRSFIPYNATIGAGVSFGHKMGIVISPNAIIGKNVKIRHQVTIGSGHAVIGDDVRFGAGVPAKVIRSITEAEQVDVGLRC